MEFFTYFLKVHKEVGTSVQIHYVDSSFKKTIIIELLLVSFISAEFGMLNSNILVQGSGLCQRICVHQSALR